MPAKAVTVTMPIDKKSISPDVMGVHPQFAAHAFGTQMQCRD
jgi:hypothetical protein